MTDGESSSDFAQDDVGCLDAPGAYASYAVFTTSW